MDVDVENSEDLVCPESAPERKVWAKPKLVALSISKTAGGETPLNIELELFIFSFNDCGPFGSNCS